MIQTTEPPRGRMDLKPIETRYKGYRFRSRLEARWAVFFDAMGIKWEYEKEGYHLEDGSLYLPDFWLTELGAFAEIKGQPFTDSESGKCDQLARQSGQMVFKLVGPPSDETVAYYGVSAAPNHTHGVTGVLIMQEVDGWVIAEPRGIIKGAVGTAIRSALSARFEHGESGAPQETSSRDSDRQSRPHVRGASAERELIRAMLHSRTQVEIIAERVGPDALHDPRYRAIYEALLSNAENTPPADMLSGEALEVAEQLVDDPPTGDLRWIVADALATLEVRGMESRLAEIDGLPPSAELEEERQQLVSLMRASGKMSFKAARRGQPPKSEWLHK